MKKELRGKRPRGRPTEKHLPPRTDASMDELAEAMFSLPADHHWQYDAKTDYHCRACRRPVRYPDTLTRAGLCSTCQ